MGLFETLALQVGPAVGKALLKCWLKDSKLAAEVSSSLVDLLKAKTTDVIAQQRGKRQFEDIGERVALSLKPIFDAEGNTLEEGSLNAVALAIAETFNKSQVISKALAEQELEPDKLAKYLMNSCAHATRHLSEAEIALYQRITSEISQQIVDIASQLPAFTEHSFAEILIRERKLLTIANQILEEVRRIHRGSEQENHERQEVARFEAEYCRAVIRRLDRLELFGVDVSTASQRYRLSVAYVSLSVEPQTLRVYREKKFEERMLTTPSAEDSKDEDGKIIIPVHELLAKTHHLLIQGLAGSGKTTLLQWIAVSAALRAFTGKLVRLNNSIPFFIPLRQCLESGYPTPEHFPRFIAPAIASTMPTNWVHERLNSGRAVVLIDGVDEVPETQRGDVRVWLEELVATYPNARFIVTARPHAIAGGWLEQGSFSYAQLRPMDLPCIHVFIDHWYAAVREQLQDDEEKAELNPLAEHLKRIIGRSLQLRNLAMNPLLCAMLCALHRDRRQQLPSDRIELYEAGCNMLLERRDRERRLELRDYPILSYRQKRVLLQDLAYWLMINKWPMVTQQSAQERLGRKLRHMPGITEDTSASEVLRLFLDRSGMLRKPVEGWVDFAHLTFQEYLAAQEALDAGDLGLLTNNAPDDQWREVIILAAGLASPKVCEQLIGALITKGDQEPQNRHKLHLLAMSGCEASLVLGGRMKVEVQNRLSQFVPPKTIAEVQALASVGDLAVPYLANDVGHKPTIAAACVQALARIGSETALETLESYSRDAREIIVDELLRAWDSFNPEDFARRVLLSGASLSLDGDILLERVRLERIRYLTKLTMLDLSNSLDVNDLSWMEDLQELTSLNLAHCVRVSDIRPFSKLSNLVSLNLSGCSNVTDLR